MEIYPRWELAIFGSGALAVEAPLVAQSLWLALAAFVIWQGPLTLLGEQ